MVVDAPVLSRKPKARLWLIAVAAILAASVTARLGLWQWARAGEKEALQQAIASRAALPPLDGSVFAPGAALPPDSVHRRVALRGRWLERHTVFLENRQMDGKPGFFVLTPLQLEDPSGGAVLVQRGWVQRNFGDRTALPVLPPEDGVVRVDGRIAPAPAKLYEFEGQQAGNIRQNLDVSSFARETGLPLASLTVLQMGLSTDGLRRDWPAVETGVAKHLGYAFQWFALCGLIVILFVWFQVVRRFFTTR